MKLQYRIVYTGDVDKYDGQIVAESYDKESAEAILQELQKNYMSYYKILKKIPMISGKDLYQMLVIPIVEKSDDLNQIL